MDQITRMLAEAYGVPVREVSRNTCYKWYCRQKPSDRFKKPVINGREIILYPVCDKHK